MHAGEPEPVQERRAGSTGAGHGGEERFGGTVIAGRVKNHRGIDAEMDGRSVGPSLGGDLVGLCAVEVSAHRGALRGRRHGDVSGFVQEIAGVGESRAVDDETAVLDQDARHECLVGQGALGDREADFAQEGDDAVEGHDGEGARASKGSAGAVATLRTPPAQKAVARRAPDASSGAVNPTREAFTGWIDCLLDSSRTPLEHRDAAHAWCAWALDRLGIEAQQLDPVGEACAQPTNLASGEAISPQRAVLCLREQQRTAVFLRALDAAVRAAREKFPGETIHVVEAGCGPAAPMALSVAARYSPDVVQVTLLDIHAASLADARRLAAEIGVERSIRATVCGDASAVRFAEADRPHVIVAEVLRRALKKEPQVAVTRALAPQLRAGGFFLPERIEVGPGVLRGLREAASAPAFEWLGAAFTLDACVAGSVAADAAGRLPERTVAVPPHAAGALQLLTRMEVFRGHVLGDFECSLTMPERLRGVPAELAAAGGLLRFAYEISADPGLRLVAAEPIAEGVAR